MFRPLETRSPEQVRHDDDSLERSHYDYAQAHVYLVKAGGTPTTVHALTGKLYLADSGWLMLSVPNAIGRGAFDALNEPGAELPVNKETGRYNAHISVMRPEEVEQIGGGQKITERGHDFHYSLGATKEVTPDSWKGVSKVYYLEVVSPELMALRRSYGLTSLPNNDKYEFHITIATRATKVLHNSDVRKGETGSVTFKVASENATPVADAYIIKGNPKIVTNDPRYDAFYSLIKQRLEGKGLSVGFDPGEEYTVPPGGKYWLGHSRGLSRLRHAPAGVATLRLDDYEDPAMQQATRNRPDGWSNPGPEHYTFNDRMGQAIDNLISRGAAEKVASSSTSVDRLHACERLSALLLESGVSGEKQANRPPVSPSSFQADPDGLPLPVPVAAVAAPTLLGGLLANDTGAPSTDKARGALKGFGAGAGGLGGYLLADNLEQGGLGKTLGAGIGGAAGYLAADRLAALLGLNRGGGIGPLARSDDTESDAVLGDIAGGKNEATARIWRLLRERRRAEAVNKMAQLDMGKQADGALSQLLEAKAESDRRNYARKHFLLRQLMTKFPTDFVIDQDTGNGIKGVTHSPTGFQVHLPTNVVPEGVR